MENLLGMEISLAMYLLTKEPQKYVCVYELIDWSDFLYYQIESLFNVAAQVSYRKQGFSQFFPEYYYWKKIKVDNCSVN